MAAHKLTSRSVEKPWGRRDLAPWFENVADGGAPVGEIWFEGPPDAPLLVKYLFTAERLSIQVHPDDTAARAAGHGRGKDEAWVVLAAEAGATIGIGLTRTVTAAELRAAALDGSIETLLDWRPARAGDVFYSAAGTVHALGAGLTLVEIQQNVDLTYRLYDYGRPRELHLEAGIAVSRAEPFTDVARTVAVGRGRAIIADGPKLSVERWTGAEGELAHTAWIVPLAGHAGIDGVIAYPGEVWLGERALLTVPPGSDVLVGFSSGGA